MPGIRAVIALLGGAVALSVAPTSAAAEPAWLPPTPLSSPLRDANAVSVEMDAAGNDVAVWMRQQVKTAGFGIQVATRPVGSGFSPPLDLAASGSEPALAMTPGGEAIVVWKVLDQKVEEVSDEVFINTSNEVLMAATIAPGGAIAAPVEVYRAPPGEVEVAPPAGPVTLRKAASPRRMRIEMNSSGAALLAWQENDPEAPAPTVMAATRPAGGAFGAATRVSPAPTADEPAELPEIAIDDAGGATVVWQHGAVDELVVQAAVKLPGQPFGPPQTLNGTLDAEEQAVAPDVAADAAGNATAVWRRLGPDDSSIEAAGRPAAGSFGAAAPISQGDEAVVFSPQVEAAPGGSAIATWLGGSPESVVEVADGQAGGAFGAPQELTDPAEDATFVSVDMDAAGTVLAWSAADGGAQVLKASVRPAGGGFGPVRPVSAATDEFVHADLAMDSHGDVSAAWLQAAGDDRLATFAGYDAFVPQLRDVSIPASGLVGEELAFSANPFDVWPIGPATISFGDGATAPGPAATHAYSAPGTYAVTVTAVDAAGTATTTGGSVTIRPRTGFTVGKLKLNKKKGTAKLPVTVEGPGRVTLRGKGVKGAGVSAESARTVQLPVKAVGKFLKKLKKKGKLKVSLSVTFTPEGGQPGTKKTKGTLRKKLA